MCATAMPPPRHPRWWADHCSGCISVQIEVAVSEDGSGATVTVQTAPCARMNHVKPHKALQHKNCRPTTQHQTNRLHPCCVVQALGSGPSLLRGASATEGGTRLEKPKGEKRGPSHTIDGVGERVFLSHESLGAPKSHVITLWQHKSSRQEAKTKPQTGSKRKSEDTAAEPEAAKKHKTTSASPAKKGLQTTAERGFKFYVVESSSAPQWAVIRYRLEA